MKKVLIIIILSVITTVTYSQFNPGGNTPGSGSGGDPGIPATGAPAAGVPFDGGLSLILLAAGFGVGAKRRKAMNL